MLEGQHFQNGYVTRDLEKSITSLIQHADIRVATSFEHSFDIVGSKGQGVAATRVAFIWINNLQYEIIQPLSGLVDIYADKLPNHDFMRFHHTGSRISNWQEFRFRVQKNGCRIAYEGEGNGVKFLFIDAQPSLGHYLEYIWMTPERWLTWGGD